jgi:hypothetical protein
MKLWSMSGDAQKSLAAMAAKRMVSPAGRAALCWHRAPQRGSVGIAAVTIGRFVQLGFRASLVSWLAFPPSPGCRR